MITKTKIPTPPSLAAMIDFYYELHHNPKNANFVLLPNGSINVLFFLSGGISFNGLNEKAKAIISCICMNRIKVKPKGRIHAIGAQLNPIMSPSITKENPLHTLDAIVDLETFYPKSLINLILEQMMEAKHSNLPFQLLEDFFLRNPDSLFLSNQIYLATRIIKDKKGQIQIKDLARQLNISQRGLRKLFLRKLGMSPKEFAMIQQFNFAVDLIKSNQYQKLTDIAYQAGYNDQAHFIKQFYSYAQVTPGQFNKIKLNGSDFYNFQSEE